MSTDPTGSISVAAMLRRALAAPRQDAAMAFLCDKHVLVIDDDPFGLDRMALVLQRLGGAGLSLSMAGSFDGAIEACRGMDGQLDIVLLNHLLWPGDADGIELLPALRRSGLARGAVSVLFSITMDEPTRRRALAAGFDDTLLTEDIDEATLRALLVRLASSDTRQRAIG